MHKNVFAARAKAPDPNGELTAVPRPTNCIELWRTAKPPTEVELVESGYKPVCSLVWYTDLVNGSRSLVSSYMPWLEVILLSQLVDYHGRIMPMRLWTRPESIQLVGHTYQSHSTQANSSSIGGRHGPSPNSKFQATHDACGVFWKGLGQWPPPPY